MISFPPLSRRRALTGLAALPTALVAPGAARADPSRTASGAPPPSCGLSPQSVEGPFYLDPGLHRSDITDGRAGVPLAIRFVVLDARHCVPLARARVDIWHASAEGHYSGYPGQGDSRAVDMTGTSFLRGTQETDETGKATFRTVYPGWYRGRTTHIHFKVIVEQRDVLTGQMYFPDALSEYIYANVAPYSTRLESRDTFNTNDGLLRMDESHVGFCDIKEERDHYLASLIVGTDPTMNVLADGEPRRPPLGAPPPMPPRAREPARVVPGVALSDQRRS